MRLVSRLLVVSLLFICLVSCVSSVKSETYFQYNISISSTTISVPWYGYYTTQDTVPIVVTVTDQSKVTFQGGQLLGAIESPAGGGWSISLNNSIPVIPVGQSYTFETSFKPVEPGVYTMSFQSLDTSHNQYGAYNTSTISGGFLVVNVEDVGVYYTELLSFGSLGGALFAVLAIVTSTVYNRRTIKEMEKQQRAANIVLMSVSLRFDESSGNAKLLFLNVKNNGPGRALDVKIQVRPIGAPNLPTNLSFSTGPLGIDKEVSFNMRIPASEFTGSEQFEVQLTATNIFGEEQVPQIVPLGLATPK